MSAHLSSLGSSWDQRLLMSAGADLAVSSYLWLKNDLIMHAVAGLAALGS